MKITIIGMGYVGLVTCVGLASIEHEIIGIDKNEEKIQMLKKGQPPIYEPQVAELLKENKEKICFKNKLEKENDLSNVIFLCVPTPRNNGKTDLSYIYQVIDEIIPYIKKKTHIVIKSTVPIGTCDEIEDYINKKAEKNIKVEVISNPEFLAQGTGVKDFIHAQRIVIGINSKKAEQLMKQIYDGFEAPYVVTDRKTSEMIKYVSNSFLALKISYINEVANLCEKIGTNIEDVIEGIGKDERIGGKYLKVGIGYGGSCLPKDTEELLETAKNYELPFKTIEAAIEINEIQNIILLEKARKYIQDFKDKKVAILGVAFKPDTDDVRKAPAIKNIDELLEEGARIIIYDKLAKKNIEKYYKEKVQCKDTIEQALEDADICFVFTEETEIKQLNPLIFKEKMKTPIVLDGRNCFLKEFMEKEEIIYESIGRR